jgi:hypothetical protein
MLFLFLSKLHILIKEHANFFYILLKCPSKMFYFCEHIDYVLEFYLTYFYIIACKYVAYHTLTTHPLLMPRPRKGRATPLPTLEAI